MKALIFAAIIASARVWDIFEAYDCQNPENTRFLSHQECKVKAGHETKRKFSLIQKMKMDNITAISCSMQETIIVNYCGAYSHTKPSGMNRYSTTKVVSPDECTKMAREGEIEMEGNTYEVKTNQYSYIRAFTHGGVWYTGTNIQCEGGAIYLDDGRLNTNMLREVHLNILVNEITLIDDNGDAINPAHQSLIGKISVGHGRIEDKTVVWTPKTKKKCKMANLGSLDMQTDDHNPSTFYNHPHMIQFSITGQSYDADCNFNVYETDLHDVFAMDYKKKNLLKLQKVNTQEINIASHFNTQIKFLSSEILRNLQDTYKFKNSPSCKTIMNGNAMTTTKITGSTFSRNLGDVSILFTCKITTVSPDNSTSGCYRQLPVTDEEGKNWYLDPTTRILLKSGSRTICGSSTVPIYRNTENEFITFVPKRKMVNTRKVGKTINKDDAYDEQTGLYPEDVVSNWLHSAFLQHFAEVSYAALNENMCEQQGCTKKMTADGMSSTLGKYYRKMSELSVPGIFGLNLEKIGGRCSIAICFLLVLYVGYHTLVWMIRFSLLKDDKTNTWTAALRASCPSVFLIANLSPRNGMTTDSE